LKVQAPAQGIMITGDFGDSKFYKVVCGCGQPDHDIDFEVEADETGVNVNTYVEAKSDYWTDVVKKRYDIDNEFLQSLDWFWKDIVNGFVRRVRLTWAVWTEGYVKTQTTIAMTEQQALNYSETLKSAIQDVKDFSNKARNRNENSTVTKLAEQGDCV
jgi:hypothetical protein